MTSPSEQPSPAGHGAPTARRAHTRERLFTAAFSVFAERGIIGASVEEICDRAGFTRGAFYSNFTDKDEFVLAILQRQAERDFRTIEEVAENTLDTTDSPNRKMTLAISRIFGDQADNRQELLVQQEIELYAARRPELRVAYRRYVDHQRGRFISLIESALSAIDYELALDPDEALVMLHGCWSQLQVTALLADKPVDPRPLDLLLKLIVRPRPTDSRPTDS